MQGRLLCGWAIGWCKSGVMWCDLFRSTARDFVVPKLPWLLEALGSTVLDFCIVCQVLYFWQKNLNHPAAAALLPGAGVASL